MLYFSYFILILSFLLFLIACIFLLKKNIIYFLYLFFYSISAFILMLTYIENFIFCWSFLLEENFIIKNPNDWVWIVFIISFYMAFILFLPYLFFCIYINISNLFFCFEQKKIRSLIFLGYYFCLLSLILLFDFSKSGMFSLNTKNDIFFEFQPELENFIIFVFGTFFDFSISLILILFLLFNYIACKNYKIILVTLTFISFWIYYWFSGAGLMQDFFLILCAILIIECNRWAFYFLFYLHKIKNYC